MVTKDKIFTIEASQITSLKEKWATFNSKETEILWKNIPWKAIEKRVNKLQSRITKAIAAGKGGLAKKLQYLLTNSFFAKLLAVRKVTTNKGKNTPGIDKCLWSTPASKLKGALSLKRKGYKSTPLRRTYIEKKGKKKKRPLGIPTMYDRAMQALYAMALDPISEATADKVSFGFRKKRCIHDAAAHIFRYLRFKNSAQWILEGDIKGCIDNIQHQWMLDNIPMDKRILKQFLKAGFLYQKKLFPTEAGTPQGGIISPILANMTLDGIELKIKEKYWVNKKGTIDRDYNKHKVNYTRYADDFVVTAKSKDILLDIKRIIKEHLKQRGLILSEEKTLITHIEQGFDFLGWNFRKHKGRLFIKPSKASLKNIQDKIRRTIKSYLPAKQENLIWKLNPIITGWANNHKRVAAKETFSKVDWTVFLSLWNWAKRRHSNKSKQWIKDRYWKKTRNRDWIFSNDKSTLKFAADTKITRHLLIKFDANHYLHTDQLYYIAREKQRKKRNKKLLPAPTGAVG
jgi:RNA-directed DNA polymerase